MEKKETNKNDVMFLDIKDLFGTTGQVVMKEVKPKEFKKKSEVNKNGKN